MKRSALLALVLLAGCGPAEERFESSGPFKPGVLKLHLAQDAPAAGLRPTSLPDSGGVIHLHPEPQLTEAHLEKVAVWNGANNDKIVMLTFDADGTARMSRLTAENVGKRIAFLVEDRLVMAPVILSKIEGGEAVLEGGYTKQEAEALAMRLTGTQERRDP